MPTSARNRKLNAISYLTPIATGAHISPRWLSGLISLLAFTAGIPEPLEVKNIPQIKPETVVSTQIIPDEAMVVLLTKTFGALDASDDSDPQQLLEQIAVNGAAVAIDGPDGIETLLFLGNGVYGGIELELLEGGIYILRVKSESLGEVRATTTVKPQILFEEI